MNLFFLIFSTVSAKYKQYFEQMFEQNRDEFLQFMILNDQYSQDKPRFKSVLDEKGVKIKRIVMDWENKLCGKMENGKNSAYSAKLGEKFQMEVQKYFPYYHEIGVQVSYNR